MCSYSPGHCFARPPSLPQVGKRVKKKHNPLSAGGEERVDQRKRGRGEYSPQHKKQQLLKFIVIFFYFRCTKLYVTTSSNSPHILKKYWSWYGQGAG
ncbi:MAG: hypothetical protein JWR50_1599 [Mucilaginibacter sp.]|nr:hypothetical protein [Mucilaginibacter sp.]